MDFDSPFFVLALPALVIIAVTRTLAEARTRRKLIEARLDDETIRALLQRQDRTDRYSSLKWGIVLIAVGLALVLIEVMPRDQEGPLAFGLILLFGGGGLLAYNAVAGIMERNDRQREREERGRALG